MTIKYEEEIAHVKKENLANRSGKKKKKEQENSTDPDTIFRGNESSLLRAKENHKQHAKFVYQFPSFLTHDDTLKKKCASHDKKKRFVLQDNLVLRLSTRDI